MLAFGRSNDCSEDKQKAFRILNSSYTQISIMTYDHLLSRANAGGEGKGLTKSPVLARRRTAYKCAKRLQKPLP